eukprot:jgi/Mesvir1/14200/Mv09653-RA.2
MDISGQSDAEPSSFPTEVLVVRCMERLDRLQKSMGSCVSNNPKRGSVLVSAAVAARAALERIPSEKHFPVGESTSEALQGTCALLTGVLAAAIRAVEKLCHRSALVKWVKQGTTQHQLDEIGRQMYALAHAIWLHSLDCSPDGSTPRRHALLGPATPTPTGFVVALVPAPDALIDACQQGPGGLAKKSLVVKGADSSWTAGHAIKPSSQRALAALPEPASCSLFLASKSLTSVTFTLGDNGNIDAGPAATNGATSGAPRLLAPFPSTERALCLLLDQGVFGVCIWSGHAGGSVRVWHQGHAPGSVGAARGLTRPFAPRGGGSSKGRHLELRLGRGDITAMGRVAPGVVWVGTAQGCVSVLRARWASAPTASSPMPSLATIAAAGGMMTSPGGGASAVTGGGTASLRSDIQAIELVTSLRRTAHAPGKAQQAGGGLGPGLFSGGSTLHAHQGPVTTILGCAGGPGAGHAVVWTWGHVMSSSSCQQADIQKRASSHRAEACHGAGEAACCSWDADTFALLGQVPCQGDGLGMALCAIHVPGVTTACADGPLLASGHAGGGVMLLDGSSRDVVAVLLPPCGGAMGNPSSTHGGVVTSVVGGPHEVLAVGSSCPPLGVSSLAVLTPATCEEPYRVCAGHGDGIVRVWRLENSGARGAGRRVQGATVELAVAAHSSAVRWMACVDPWVCSEAKLMTSSQEGVMRVWRVFEEESTSRCGGGGADASNASITQGPSLANSSSLAVTHRAATCTGSAGTQAGVVLAPHDSSLGMSCEQAILVAQDEEGVGLALLGVLDGFTDDSIDTSGAGSYSLSYSSRQRSYATDRSRKGSFMEGLSGMRDGGGSYLHPSSASSGALGNLFQPGLFTDKGAGRGPLEQGYSTGNTADSLGDTATAVPTKPPTTSQNGAPAPPRVVQFASDVIDKPQEQGWTGLSHALGGGGEVAAGTTGITEGGARAGMYGRILSTGSNGAASNWGRATSFGSNASSVRGGWGRLPSSSSLCGSQIGGLSPAGSGVLSEDELARTASQNGGGVDEPPTVTGDDRPSNTSHRDAAASVGHATVPELPPHASAKGIMPGENAPASPAQESQKSRLSESTPGRVAAGSMGPPPPRPRMPAESITDHAGEDRSGAATPGDGLDTVGSRQLAAKYASSGPGQGAPASRGSCLLPWEIDVREIKMVRPIGGGSYGDVFLAHWRCTEVAVKKVRPCVMGSLASNSKGV